MTAINSETIIKTMGMAKFDKKVGWKEDKRLKIGNKEDRDRGQLGCF